MYLLISYVLLTITLLSYLFPNFFSMIYWARRINSSSQCYAKLGIICCQKHFTHRAKHFGKTPNSISTANEPYWKVFLFRPFAFNHQVFIHIHQEWNLSPETLKGSGGTPYTSAQTVNTKCQVRNVTRNLNKNVAAIVLCAIFDPSNPVIEEL